MFGGRLLEQQHGGAPSACCPALTLTCAQQSKAAVLFATSLVGILPIFFHAYFTNQEWQNLAIHQTLQVTSFLQLMGTEDAFGTSKN